MTYRDLFVMVSGNLRRMRWRTLLTAAGVVIGTSALVLLVSLGVGLQKLATDSIAKQFGSATILTVMPFGQFGMMGPGPTQGASDDGKKKADLDDTAVKRFKALPDVEAVVPFREIPISRLKFRRLEGPPFSLVGVDRRDLRALGLKTVEGKPTLRGNNILLGAEAPKAFFDSNKGTPVRRLKLLGKRLEVFIDKNAIQSMAPNAMVKESVGQPKTYRWRVKVAGILKAGSPEDGYKLYISSRQAKKFSRFLPRQQRKEYSSVRIKVEDPGQVGAVQKEIEKMGFSSMSLVDILKGINTFFVIIQAVLGGVASIALLVAAFGIANTMTMAIYERTREIGIMKAIGAAGGDIMRVFLAEAATIGFLGGVGGVVFGFLGGKVINFGLYMYYAEQMKDIEGGIIATPLWLVLFTLVFATIVGVLSGAMPASRASRLSPLGALRHE